MSTVCAVIDYKSDKNCFLTLPQALVPHSTSEQLVVYEVQVEGKDSVFCSWSGEVTHVQTEGANTVLLNGLYANKLGIEHGSAIVLKRVTGVPECARVFVEPVSVEDWEILEIHSRYVEAHLLDQVRVIWRGQVLPVWVTSAICIFLKIGVIHPASQCVLLVNNTEVIVDPKVRQSSQGQTVAGVPPAPSPIGQNESQRLTGDKTTCDDQSNLRRLSSNESQGSAQSSGFMQGLTSYVKSFIWTPESIKDVTKAKVETKGDNSAVLVKSFKCGFRVQPLRLSEEEAQLEYSTNVFVRYSDVAPKNYEHGNMTDNRLPSVFYAKITKIPSPVDKEEERKTAEVKDSEKVKGNNPASKPPSNSLKANKKTNSAIDLCAIVRVVTVEMSGICINKSYHCITQEVLQQQPLLDSHMIVSDFLRRQLKLDATGHVQLEAVCYPPGEVATIYVYQISDLLSSINSDMVRSAFRSWLHRAVEDRSPLVIFQQMLVRFPILPEVHLEALLTFDPERTNRSGPANYAVIHVDMCESLSIVVQERTNGRRKWPEITHHPCSCVSEFDPSVPTVMLEKLGGLTELLPKALAHIEMCFGQRPLTQAVYPSLIGLHTGVLLITGARGTGKSTLAKALCRRVAGLPCLAYTSVLECKALKGKRPETIQRLLEKIFDKSSWRQPSVIVLDDVDVLAGASSSPDSEMTGEAQYMYKLSEVIRTIIKCELINNPRLAVIFTSRSRASVHPSLVSSRGLHIVQEELEIKPPGKVEKREILEAILRSKPSVNPGCVGELPLQDLSSRMEGFVAQDLWAVVDRAIHAHRMSSLSGSDTDISLCEEDFEAALESFTPASLREVTLHQETDIGWGDIGGLGDVKKTLVETLEWPTKYPQLFANCPLRLRSGLLLFGAPGTGKTLLARAVAKECGLNFISIKGPELLSKYIGASEQAVRDTFSRAQSAKPCILFFDEFDSIAPRRGHDSTGVTDRVVNQLLTQMDGVEGLKGVYVLGATSRPDLIDPALLRPGRLDKCLHCEIPTSKERLEILTALARKLNFSDDVDLEAISEHCVNFTGADFKALLYNAQLEAIHAVTSVLKGHNSASPMEDLEEKTQMVCKNVTSLEKSYSGTREDTPAAEAGGCMTQTQSVVTYIPRLEEGPVTLEPEAEKQFLLQVNQLGKRLKKLSRYRSTSGSVSDVTPTQEDQSNTMIQVNQSHLLKAAKETRPSVSAEERLKYQMIYSNFVKSRGGDFDSGSPSTGKRMTLA